MYKRMIRAAQELAKIKRNQRHVNPWTRTKNPNANKGGII